jgi:hypothetical protein
MSIKIIIRRLLHLPYLPLVIAPIILLSPVLFTGKALFWGTPATQFIPWWKWSFDSILSGNLPLWNPLLGMGAPLIANYQSALFYPPNWIYFIFYIIGDVPALAWSQALLVTLHLIWSGIGMAVFTRKIGLGKLGQVVSGLSFGLSGYLVARAWFASINTSVAWLPWVLIFSYDTTIPDKKKYPTIKLGIVIGLQLLAGHAQTSWCTWLLAGMLIVYWNWDRVKGDRVQIRRLLLAIGKSWGYLVVAIMIGAALSAIQLFPTAVYLLQSQRAAAAVADFRVICPKYLWKSCQWELLGVWKFLGRRVVRGSNPTIVSIICSFQGFYQTTKKKEG